MTVRDVTSCRSQLCESVQKKDKIGAFDLYAPGYRAFRLKISKSVRGVYGSSFGFDPYRLLAPQRTTHVVEL